MNNTDKAVKNVFDSRRASYNYCAICGHTPEGDQEPNRAPIRFWDPDDGYKIATLCRSCWEDYGNVKPKESDYAYDSTNGVCDDCNTDEDPTIALYERSTSSAERSALQ